MGQRAESAVGGGMAVAADDGHAGQGPALFGADDMHDALTHVRHRIVVDAEILGVLVERFDLNAAVFGHRGRIGAVQRRGDVVIRHGDGLFGCADGAAGHAQAFKGLRAGDLMHEVAVDIQQAGAVIGLMDNVIVPDLVVKGTRAHGSALFCSGMVR